MENRPRSWAPQSATPLPRAQYHLRQTMVFFTMLPLNRPEVMIGNAADRFDAEGNLSDETTKDDIRKLLQTLVVWTRRIQQSPVNRDATTLEGTTTRKCR